MAAPALRTGEIVRIRDARWSVAACTRYEDAAVIEVRGCGRDNAGFEARFLLPFEPLERLPVLRAPRVVRPACWRRTARHVLARSVPRYDSLESAAAANFTLLPFQLEPALAVSRGAASRLLIADEVGLGKTVQAGLVISETLRRYPADGRALVVCPAGLRAQWQLELHTRFGMGGTVLDATALGHYTAHPGFNPWAAHPVVITSIDYVKRPEVMRALEPLVWDVVVFDEAHSLSGRSDRRNAAAVLADRSRIVVLLTATPHSGDDEAFARLTTLGSLGRPEPLCAFRRTRADVGLSRARRTLWLRVRQTADECRMHDALATYVGLIDAPPAAGFEGARLVAAVLTRRAWSSAASLVRSLERRLALLDGAFEPDAQLALPLAGPDGDEEPGLMLGLPGLGDRALECRLLSGLLGLARAAAGRESKVEAIDRLLRRTREPAIVFTEYRDTLATLEAALAHYGPVTLHGGMSDVERRDRVRQFTGSDARLLLATDAASEGLNLHQRCRLVINLELPWTPVRLEQRVGRVERIGQQRRVHAIHLVSAATTEEAAIERLALRMDRAGRALGAMHGGGNDPGGREPDSTIASPYPAASLPATVTAVDLHDTATAEAKRLSVARHLAAASGPDRRERACVTRLRRRTASGECLWAFRLAFADAAGQPVWEATIGLRTHGAVPRLLSACETAAWFERAAGEVEPAVRGEQERILRALRDAMRAPLGLAIAREDAILEGLNGRRARMAASLLQRSLFDRRAEHEAAAQEAVLAAAVARCSSRRTLLAARERVANAGHELAFAVLLG